MTSLLGTTNGISPWIEKTVLSSISNSKKKGKRNNSTEDEYIRARMVQVESTPPVSRSSNDLESPLFFTIHDGHHKIVVFTFPICLPHCTLPPRYSIIKLKKYHVSTMALNSGREALNNPILLGLGARKTEYYPKLCLYANEIQLMEEGGSSMGLATSLPELIDINESIRIKLVLKALKASVLTQILMANQPDSMRNFAKVNLGSLLYIMNGTEKKWNKCGDSQLTVEMVINTMSKVLKRRLGEDGLQQVKDTCPPILRKMITYLESDDHNTCPVDKSILDYHFEKNLRSPSFEMLEQCLWDLSEKYPILLHERGDFREFELKPVIRSVLDKLMINELELLPSQENHPTSDLFQVVSDLFGRVENISQVFISIRANQNFKLTQNIANAILDHMIEMAILSYEVKLCLKRTLSNISWCENSISVLKNCGLLFYNDELSKKIRVLVARLDVRERENLSNPDLMHNSNNHMTVSKIDGAETTTMCSKSMVVKGKPRTPNGLLDMESQTNTVKDPESQLDFNSQIHEEEQNSTSSTSTYHDTFEDVNDESQQLLDPETQPISKPNSCKNGTQVPSAHVYCKTNEEGESTKNRQTKENDRTSVVGISEMMASEDIESSSEDEDATVMLTRGNIQIKSLTNNCDYSNQIDTKGGYIHDSPLLLSERESQIESQVSSKEKCPTSVRDHIEDTIYDNNSSDKSTDRKPKRHRIKSLKNKIETPDRNMNKKRVHNKRELLIKYPDFLVSRDVSNMSPRTKERFQRYKMWKRYDCNKKDHFRVI